jgi:hypothetical protein
MELVLLAVFAHLAFLPLPDFFLRRLPRPTLAADVSVTSLSARFR